MRSRRNPLSLVLLLAFPSPALATQHKKLHKLPAKAPVAAPQPAPAAVMPPPPPPTPEHEPSSPPEVTYQAGQLTIIARNSTMGDVLNAVKQKTGAAVEMPVSSSERVVGQFGPGAPRDVMAQLLNGSHYDYVLVGSPSDPGALKKVVLTARANGPETPPSAQNIPPQNLPSVPDVENEQSMDDNEPPVDAQQPSPEEQAQPQQPPPAQPAIKTPEQLLRELQQQQQRQQPQQQNGPQPGPPQQ